MAERIPFLTLNLGDGVERRFRFTLNSIIAFQQATGLKMSEFARSIVLMDKDAGLLRKVIWCGLSMKDREGLSEEALGELLGIENFLDIGLQVVAYLQATMGITEDDLKNGDRAALDAMVKAATGSGAPPSEPPPGSASPPQPSTS